MGSQGTMNKRHPYQESIRVPFIVHWPDTIPAGHKADELYGSIDIMPSILSLAGLKVPDNCMGQDFSPVMLGKKGPDPESQFIMHIDNKKVTRDRKINPAPFFRGVRTKRYTYAIGINGEWVLYDNQEDPFQMNNLINNPDYEDERQRLWKMVDEWLSVAEDPFLGTDTNLLGKETRNLSIPDRIEKAAFMGRNLPVIFKQINLKNEQIEKLDNLYKDSSTKTGRDLKFYGKVKEILNEEQYQKFIKLEFE
jgi:hypothetical protein